MAVIMIYIYGCALLLAGVLYRHFFPGKTELEEMTEEERTEWANRE